MEEKNNRSGQTSEAKPRVLKLNMEEWCRLAKEGTAIPITTVLRGFSMEPLIRVNKDPVTIIPVNRELIPGDVVLFERADGAYVLHRLYKILESGEKVQTWGDNCEYPDAPIPRTSVLGIAVAYERDGKQHMLDTDEQRRKGLGWLESNFKRNAFIKARRLKLKLGNAARKVGIIK